MNKDRIVVVLHMHKQGRTIDLDIPLDISAYELIKGLNDGLKLGLDTGDITKCHLKTENPIAFLKGNKSIRDYGLRNGTIINYTL